MFDFGQNILNNTSNAPCCGRSKQHCFPPLSVLYQQKDINVYKRYQFRREKNSDDPGIAQLNEKGSIRLGEPIFLAAKIIIAVSQKEHCAGINLVGEQQLSEEALELWIYIECIIAGIIVVIYVLNDSSEKSAHIELVDNGRLADVCCVKACILDSHSLKGMVKGKPQVLAEIVTQVRIQPESFPQPGVCIVNLISNDGGHI